MDIIFYQLCTEIFLLTPFSFRYAFSKNGLPTITSKDPSVKSFGKRRNGETTGSDIQQIKKAYCKPKPVKPVAICK